MTPAQDRVLRWWLVVDFVTGSSIWPHVSSPPRSHPASWRTISSRTGSDRACSTSTISGSLFDISRTTMYGADRTIAERRGGRQRSSHPGVLSPQELIHVF